NEWTYIFKDLDVVDSSGKPYIYTVKEEILTGSGYKQKQEVSGDQNDGFIVTNEEITSINVIKEWKDEEGTAKRPPEGVEVQLSRSVDNVKDENFIETTTLNSTNDWKHTFEKLSVFDGDNQRYEYTVSEISKPEGYK